MLKSSRKKKWKDPLLSKKFKKVCFTQNKKSGDFVILILNPLVERGGEGMMNNLFLQGYI